LPHRLTRSLCGAIVEAHRDLASVRSFKDETAGIEICVRPALSSHGGLEDRCLDAVRGSIGVGSRFAGGAWV